MAAGPIQSDVDHQRVRPSREIRSQRGGFLKGGMALGAAQARRMEQDGSSGRVTKFTSISGKVSVILGKQLYF